MADGRRRQGFALAAVARQVSEMWWNKTGQDLDPAVWHRLIFGWIKHFGGGILFDALQEVVVAAHRRSAKPDFADVPSYARVLRANEDEPGSGDCYLVRGSLRKFYCAEDNKRILDLLLKAMRSGVSKRAMDAAVAQSDNLDDFLSRIGIDPREYYEPQENQAA